ncbi:42632_t:CDS:2, partial [Gigaspora margarita]
MHIKKTHGCHPAGRGCSDRSSYKCGAQVTYANLLPNSILNITVLSPNYDNKQGTSAIGYFNLHIDNKGGSYTFLTKPVWVNAPPRGTWFDIWISIYWNCEDKSGRAVGCN